jgi:outer membrane protein TolC
VGVVVEWNCFDGGRRGNQSLALEQQARAVGRNLAEAKSIVALDVRQAWLDMQETRQRIQVAHQAIAQAEENLRVVRERFNMGAGTNTEVLDAEYLRVESRYDLNQSVYDAAAADVRLLRATGDL